MTRITLQNGKLVNIGGKVGTEEECCCGGCTNPYSPNYDPDAVCDDGSCETCCLAGLCVLEDPDCQGNCNSLTQAEGCNDIPFGEPGGDVCLDCCDGFCQNGCVDPPAPAPDDCSPTYASSYTVPANQSCSGQEIVYHSCLECEFVNPP